MDSDIGTKRPVKEFIADKIRVKMNEESDGLRAAIVAASQLMGQARTRCRGTAVDYDWLFETLREADEAMRSARGRLMTLRGLRYSLSVTERAQE
jgi:hypothetical protein